MTTALILIALVALAALLAAATTTFVRHDGYGRPTAGRTPPRSHAPDLFEPRRVA
jgi:hypothetical protein